MAKQTIYTFEGMSNTALHFFLLLMMMLLFSKTALVTFFSPTSKTKMINSSTERENENVSEY